MEIQPQENNRYKLVPSEDEYNILAGAIRQRVVRAATGQEVVSDLEAQTLVGYLHLTSRSSTYHTAYPRSLDIFARALEDYLPRLDTDKIESACHMIQELRVSEFTAKVHDCVPDDFLN